MTVVSLSRFQAIAADEGLEVAGPQWFASSKPKHFAIRLREGVVPLRAIVGNSFPKPPYGYLGPTHSRVARMVEDNA